LTSKILGESIVDVKKQTIRYELFDTPDISDLVTALLSPCPDIRIGVETTNDDVADEDNDSEDNQNNSEES